MRSSPLILLSAGAGLITALSACPASKPVVDTPQTLPPAAPPADVSRTPAAEAADAGNPEQQTDAPKP